MCDGEPMVELESVPTETTLLVRVRNVDEEKLEVMLHRVGDRVIAWENACQHMTHVPIDKGDGATMRAGEFVCQNHGAYFDAESGLCTFGPCEGAVLPTVDVTVDNRTVYLTDDSYDFVGMGPLERDPTDLASTSNVEF